MAEYQKIAITRFLDDPIIKQCFTSKVQDRINRVKQAEARLTGGKANIADFASGHEYYGLHKIDGKWVLREWAPNATEIHLIGDCNEWKTKKEYAYTKIDPQAGVWELKLDSDKLKHLQLFKLKIKWNGGEGERIPAYIRRVVQDEKTKIFSAQVWAPDEQYIWKYPNFKPDFKHPLIYESHIGMAQEKEAVGTYEEYRKNILPRIVDSGYNTVQIMALMEHPYYGSFGYHVSNFFAASSRFGTPEELKALIDEAHGMGLAVIMDLVHSHAVKNEIEGLSRFDGTMYQYFHDGARGEHSAWDSRCFNYGKTEVLHFLLSNCRFWLDEYKIDGYRFDGITSMMYYDHGLGTAFGHYDHYFDASVDEDAITYLSLANKVIHSVKPSAMTVAEDVSGMPGLGAKIEDGGIGFDYRLALGNPDFWFHLFKKVKDEYWSMDGMFYEMINRRSDEKTISYVECHDQAIVGSKTMAFELMDADMYWSMDEKNTNMIVDRGMALHKMVRLVTLSLANGGYLNFMGNEFGHPEWIDFPREGNGWSYKHARRQWNLRDAYYLKYHFLADFDKEMLRIVNKYGIIDLQPSMLYSHYDDKILAYMRGDIVFIYNFHATKSVSDYFIDLPEGDYNLIMNSDDTRFGGHGRIAEKQNFITAKTKKKNMPTRVGINIYLPCRSSMILKKGAV